MATTMNLGIGEAAVGAARSRMWTPSGPLLEPVSVANAGVCGCGCRELVMMVEKAKGHYIDLNAEPMYRHVVKVLDAALRGKLIVAREEGLDRFSKAVAELILYHPIESDAYLPASGLSKGFAARAALQRMLKTLDATSGDRSAEYRMLLSDGRFDQTDMIVALYARIADMMTVHDTDTVSAAKTRMPGVFPMHESWQEVQRAWADPMLRIYCPIADWGSSTVAYREMRDNAMYYMDPAAFARVSEEADAMMPALLNTNLMMQLALHGMAKRFGLKVLVAYDLPTVSSVLPRLDRDTIAVAVRPFKGAGGLMDKSAKKGIPISKVHDWSGAMIIADTQARMYDYVSYLYEGGIRRAAAECGVPDLHTIFPKDYASRPKPVTLYQSVHLDTVSAHERMVPMELIVRTVDMHVKADEGSAGHEIYKLSPLVNGERRRFEQRKRQLAALPAWESYEAAI